MQYKNYIWDFDGTLFDSYPHILSCMEMVCREEGIVCDRTELWRHLIVNFIVGRRFAGLSDEAYRRFVEYELRLGDVELSPIVVPFPDTETILRAIIKNGGRNYLYTHRNISALKYLESAGFADCFADYVTSEEKFPTKPAPDAVLAIIKRNELDPAETVMVGDRFIDGMSGVNAGIAGALITAASDAIGDGVDGVAFELEQVPALSGVPANAMTHVFPTLTVFGQELGII